MRRYVSYVVSTAALFRYRRHTTTTTSEKEQPYCILCDAHLTAPLTADAWATHATTVSHHARTIIATSYCATAREKHIHDSLTRHFNLDFNEVEESAARRTARRRERLISSLEKVVQDGLLSQSIPIRGEDGELVVGDRFSIYATTGLSHVQCALFKQTAVLLPTVPARDLQVLIQYLTSTRCLSRMFDALQYDRLLTNNDGKRVTLRSEEKAAVLLATLGELALFDSRERKPHAVTDRSAASILVQHVLVSHALDTLVAEVLHTTLQRVVDESHPVWPEAREQMTYWTRQQSEAHQQKEKESTDHHTNRLSLSAAPEQPGPTVAATKEERQRMTAELTSFLSTLEKVGEGTTHPGSRKVREGPLEVRAPRVLGDWQLLNKA